MSLFLIALGLVSLGLGLSLSSNLDVRLSLVMVSLVAFVPGLYVAFKLLRFHLTADPQVKQAIYNSLKI